MGEMMDVMQSWVESSTTPPFRIYASLSKGVVAKPVDLPGALATDAVVVIVCDDPQVALARVLEAGQNMAAALIAWKELAAAHLDLCRGTAGRVVLVGDDLLKDRAALQARLPDALELPALPVAPPVARLAQGVAAAVLASDPDAQALFQELMDRGLSEAAEVTQPTLAQMIREGATLPDQVRLQTAQLMQLQATVESDYREAAALRTELEKIADERDGLRHEHGQLQDELHRVYASRSWRITRPLRGLLALTQK